MKKTQINFNHIPNYGEIDKLTTNESLENDAVIITKKDDDYFYAYIKHPENPELNIFVGCSQYAITIIEKLYNFVCGLMYVNSVEFKK